MEKVYTRPESWKDVPTPYCPGCHHGIAQKLLAEVVDEMGIRGKAVYSGAVGCNGMANFFINMDAFGSQHGRCAAAASAFKKVSPESIVICYQGDGDAACIGTAESIHAARRGDPITVIFANNTLYGMTGGQSAPTTLVGQVTKTAIQGNETPPMHFAEMIATLQAPDYVTRCAVNNPKNILKFKKALKHAIECQMNGKYAFIEVLTACAVSSGIPPMKTPQYIDEVVAKEFPLGDIKVDGKMV